MTSFSVLLPLITGFCFRVFLYSSTSSCILVVILLSLISIVFPSAFCFSFVFLAGLVSALLHLLFQLFPSYELKIVYLLLSSLVFQALVFSYLSEFLSLSSLDLYPSCLIACSSSSCIPLSQPNSIIRCLPSSFLFALDFYTSVTFPVLLLFLSHLCFVSCP
jgi:hypothetical protein